MVKNSFQGSGESLSVGNVISAGIRIYRDHFQPYYIEALRSYLWILVPVYGWAKFAAIQGMLGRLAFHEVIEQPESIPEARLRVKPRLWSFLLANILLGLIFFGFFFVIILGGAALGVGIGVGIQNGSPLGIILGLLLVIFIVFALFAYIWILSRFSFVDLAIAVELVSDLAQAISRSWKLTEGYVIKLQTIYFVAILVTLPTAIIGNLGSLVLGEENPVGSLIDLVLSVLTGALVIPFWQAIKAVIFYDLKSRKEGIDLSME